MILGLTVGPDPMLLDPARLPNPKAFRFGSQAGPHAFRFD